jgi:SSS family solute:Na+ symporter
MLLPFRRCGPAAALAAWSGGVLTFMLIKFVFPAKIASFAGDMTTAINVGGPVIVTLLLYLVIGLFTRGTKPAADALLESIHRDLPADKQLMDVLEASR